MECIICESGMTYYFTKNFGQYDLNDVDYWRCPKCGFCASKTHFDMTKEQWEKLNVTFHSDSNHRKDNPYNRNQRYFNQALMLYLMVKHEIIDSRPWLDWGAGVGSVSTQLQKHFNLELLTYDKYVTPKLNSLREGDFVNRDYNVVVNTAVFEHVRDRRTLDEIESHVKVTGCLAVHTLIRGSIPKDPDWMYLLPVHCAFHTNKSMQMLMDAWGYSCSVYNEQSRMWVMFHESPATVEEKVNKLNDVVGWEYLHYKEGFMDYWP